MARLRMSLGRWLQARSSLARSAMLMTAAPVAAETPDGVYSPPSPTPLCNAISPVAFPCVALDKSADAVSWSVAASA